jgi:hypothetical protein
MKNFENDLQQANMMIHNNGLNFNINGMSACKCQNCNNVKLDESTLDKKEIESMFKELLK